MAKFYRISVTVQQENMQTIFDLLKDKAWDFEIKEVSHRPQVSKQPMQPAPVPKFDRHIENKTTRRPWNKEELKYLRKASKDGTSAKEVASSLGRTEGATRQKAVSLGLSLESRRVQQPSASSRGATTRTTEGIGSTPVTEALQKFLTED